MKHVWLAPCAMFSVLFVAGAAQAQRLSLPPNAGNQMSSVTQGLGLVRVTIEYRSPDVDGREGKIWGALVPMGYGSAGGFGTCGEKCPWRAGANESTVFTTSHDILVEGKKLKAGSYGLHMIPGEKRWTVIFSNNSDSWGSFYYDPKLDALRVTVAPKKNAFTEYLTYEFTERKLDTATVELQWENLAVPITITAPNIKELHFAKIRDQLTGATGFNAGQWQQAAQFCLDNRINLKTGLKWAEFAVNGPFVGQENFNNLITLSRLQAANGKTKDAESTAAKALAHDTATPIAIHLYGRQLLGQGKKKQAMKVFEANARKYPDQWPVHVGLARGYSSLGNYEKAAEHAQIAADQAPDPLNKENLKRAVADLKAGKPMS